MPEKISLSNNAIIENPSVNTNRVGWIDVTKGIGIIAVVLSHSQFDKVVWFLSACYVPVFFVLAGYTLKKSNMGYGQYVNKKSRRLLLPYAFCMALVVFFNLLYSIIWHVHFDWFRSTVGVLYSRAALFPSEMTSFLMLPMNSQPMWFLTALFITLILSYPIVNYISNYNRYVIPALFIIAYLMTYLPILLPWSLDSAPLFIIMVLAGYLIRERNLLNMKFYLFILVALVYCIVLYVNGSVNYSIREYGNSVLLTLIASILGSLLIMKLSQLVSKVAILSKPFIVLGKHSLYIMCFHLPILTLFTKLIERFISISPFYHLVYCVTVLLSILLSLFLSIFIQRHLSF